MTKSRVWALGVLGLAAAAGVVAGGWHPWQISRVASGPATAKHRAIKVSAVGNSPVPITWAEAQAKFPTLARVPGWLPVGVTHSSLTYGGHGNLDASYAGPQYKWTVMISEDTGSVVTVAPHQAHGTVGGIPALIAQWDATPGGAHLTNVAFQLDRHSYDVNGINISLAVAEHVAMSLIHP
ncbi:MAG: hypothetical protein M0Z54_08355 [Thermaerobacter sp.]|nr:hypothetical protein [Thermaerobacter sp.]